jgi:hypothetical protein
MRSVALPQPTTVGIPDSLAKHMTASHKGAPGAIMRVVAREKLGVQLIWVNAMIWVRYPGCLVKPYTNHYRIGEIPALFLKSLLSIGGGQTISTPFFLL